SCGDAATSSVAAAASVLELAAVGVGRRRRERAAPAAAGVAAVDAQVRAADAVTNGLDRPGASKQRGYTQDHMVDASI
ncbi:hypothetical protein ZWY2020_001567, partial [Hordeum vulgare]